MSVLALHNNLEKLDFSYKQVLAISFTIFF